MFSDFSQEQFLSHTELFSHIAPEEIRSLLFCLGAIEKTYDKGETIYRAGQTITDIGMVLSGSVNMVVNFVDDKFPKTGTNDGPVSSFGTSTSTKECSLHKGHSFSFSLS